MVKRYNALGEEDGGDDGIFVLSNEYDALTDRIKALEAREAVARAILEPLYDCDPAIRAWLRCLPQLETKGEQGGA